MNEAAAWDERDVSLEEYLVQETQGEVRHEYVDGRMYAMAGASTDHELIVVSLASLLRGQLRGGPCRAFAGGMRVLIPTSRSTNYYYPDVLVDCSSSIGTHAEKPTVIFEVLSPSTSRFDRVEKLTNYRTLPSLRTYVLVDQSRAEVIVYRRRSDDDWQADFVRSMEASIELPEIGCVLPLREIYEGTAVLR